MFQKGVESIVDNLHKEINIQLRVFSARYNINFPIHQENEFVSLSEMANTLRLKHNGKLLILVDEYDRFANKLMAERHPEIDTGRSGDPSLFSREKLL